MREKITPGNRTSSHRFARAIADYWAANGHPGTVNFWVAPLGNTSYKYLVTDMVNGLPRSVYEKQVLRATSAKYE